MYAGHVAQNAYHFHDGRDDPLLALNNTYVALQSECGGRKQESQQASGALSRDAHQRGAKVVLKATTEAGTMTILEAKIQATFTV